MKQLTAIKHSIHDWWDGLPRKKRGFHAFELGFISFALLLIFLIIIAELLSSEDALASIYRLIVGVVVSFILLVGLFSLTIKVFDRLGLKSLHLSRFVHAMFTVSVLNIPLMIGLFANFLGVLPLLNNVQGWLARIAFLPVVFGNAFGLVVGTGILSLINPLLTRPWMAFEVVFVFIGGLNIWLYFVFFSLYRVVYDKAMNRWKKKHLN